MKAHQALILGGSAIMGVLVSAYVLSMRPDPPPEVMPKIFGAVGPEDAADCRMEMRRVTICGRTSGLQCTNAMAEQYNDCMTIKELEWTQMNH